MRNASFLKIGAAALLFAGFALSLSGCGNHAHPPLEEATGTVSLTLARGFAARTIAPPTTTVNDFDNFRLDFFAEGNDTAVPNVSQDWDGSGTITLSLSAGEWRLVATAFIGGLDVARDEVAGIDVVPGQAVSVTVRLRPIEEGEGSFRAEIRTATDGGTVVAVDGRIAVKPLSAGATPEFESRFSKDESGVLNVRFPLRAGQYSVALTVTYDRGREVTVSEILHIYRNMESLWEWDVKPTVTLLDHVMGSWDGSSWDFGNGRDIDKEHLAFLGSSLTPPEERVSGTDNIYFDDQNIGDIASLLGGFSSTVNPPLPSGGYYLERFRMLMDAALLKRAYENTAEGWLNILENMPNQVEAMREIRRVVDTLGNGSEVTFDWDHWAANSFDLPVTVGPYELIMQIVPTIGSDVVVIQGPSEIRLNDQGLSTGEYSASTPAGNVLSISRWEVLLYVSPGGSAPFPPSWGNIDGNGMLTITDPNVAGETLLVMAEIDVDDGMGGPVNTLTGEVRVDVIAASPPAPTLSAASPVGGFQVYVDGTVTVLISGANLGGAGTVAFGDVGVLPATGSGTGNLPTNVAGSGTFTIHPDGTGSGTLTLGGRPAHSQNPTRRITVSIRGGAATFELPIAPPPPPALTAEVEHNTMSAGSGGTAEVLVTALNFTSADGVWNFAPVPGTPPGPRVSGLPPGVTVDANSSITYSVNAGTGSGTLRLIAATSVTEGAHNVTVTFGMGANVASAAFELRIRSSVYIDDDGVLHWNVPPGGSFGYALYATERKLDPADEYELYLVAIQSNDPNPTSYNLRTHPWSTQQPIFASGALLRITVRDSDSRVIGSVDFTVP